MQGWRCSRRAVVRAAQRDGERETAAGQRATSPSRPRRRRGRPGPGRADPGRVGAHRGARCALLGLLCHRARPGAAAAAAFDRHTPAAPAPAHNNAQAPQALAAGADKAAGGGNGQLRVSVACMSRAGREPGFKKTNQDNCFAFEKYITEDQSLFGAMDGHGPHGE